MKVQFAVERAAKGAPQLKSDEMHLFCTFDCALDCTLDCLSAQRMSTQAQAMITLYAKATLFQLRGTFQLIVLQLRRLRY